MKKHKLTLQDLNSIAEFNVIVMNYLKMIRLLNKDHTAPINHKHIQTIN